MPEDTLNTPSEVRTTLSVVTASGKRVRAEVLVQRHMMLGRTYRTDRLTAIHGTSLVWSWLTTYTVRLRREGSGTWLDVEPDFGAFVESFDDGLALAERRLAEVGARTDREPIKPSRTRKPAMPAPRVPKSYRSIGHRLHAVLAARGYRTPEARYDLASAICGRDITSLGSLTEREAELIEASTDEVTA